jgi:hypothetical protein
MGKNQPKTKGAMTLNIMTLFESVKYSKKIYSIQPRFKIVREKSRT